MRPALITLLVIAGCQPSGDAPQVSDASILPAPEHNTLTSGEIDAGWQLLFDGSSTDGWRGYNQDAFPEEGWNVADGHLIVFASDGSEEGESGRQAEPDPGAGSSPPCRSARCPSRRAAVDSRLLVACPCCHGVACDLMTTAGDLAATASKR